MYAILSYYICTVHDYVKCSILKYTHKYCFKFIIALVLNLTVALPVGGSMSTCVEGNVEVSDVGISQILLAASGGRLGRVEVCVNGSRVGISGDSWDNEEASVLCRQLGFSQYGEYPSLLCIPSQWILYCYYYYQPGAIPIDDYGQRLLPIPFTVVSEPINCIGFEQTIQECLVSTSALSCSRNYAGVVCQGA